MSLATRIPFHVLADYDAAVLETYIDVLAEANQED